ncbi:LOW QUALITY PROTEIN: hypothetical protein HID58_051275, partial [Brassica napus]
VVTNIEQNHPNLKGVWFCYGGTAVEDLDTMFMDRKTIYLGKGRDTWTGVKRVKKWKRLHDEDLIKKNKSYGKRLLRLEQDRGPSLMVKLPTQFSTDRGTRKV